MSLVPFAKDFTISLLLFLGVRVELLDAEFVLVHFPAYIAFVIGFSARARLGDDDTFEIFTVEAFALLLSSGVLELSAQEAVVWCLVSAVGVWIPLLVV